MLLPPFPRRHCLVQAEGWSVVNMHPVMIGLLGLLPLAAWWLGSRWGRDRESRMADAVVYGAWVAGVVDERQRDVLRRAMRRKR